MAITATTKAVETANGQTTTTKQLMEEMRKSNKQQQYNYQAQQQQRISNYRRIYETDYMEKMLDECIRNYIVSIAYDKKVARKSFGLSNSYVLSAKPCLTYLNPSR